MLIGLLSDTHIPDRAKKLPDQLRDIFHGVDLILHAGDIYEVSVLNELEHIAPMLAAQGDDDLSLTIVNDRRVKWKHTISVEGVTIWLIHQYEIRPWDRYEKPPDVIVFGHTHEATIVDGTGILQINPGSLTFPHYVNKLGTVGLLSINAGKAEAQIVQLY